MRPWASRLWSCALAFQPLNNYSSRTLIERLHQSKPISTVSRIKWRLLTGFVQVCAMTAKAMLRHVLNARLVKVPSSRRVSALSR